MSFKIRLLSALAPVCLLPVLLASPHHAEAQNPSQVHAITGLPLPPDDDNATPAVTPPAKPAPVVMAPAPKPAVTPKPTLTPKPAKNVTPKPEPPPPAAVPLALPATPPVEAASEPVVVAPAPKPPARNGRRPKPEPAVAPAPFDNSVHAIRLPPPPDEMGGTPTPEAPPPTPAAALPRPMEPKPAPKAAAKAKPAPAPKPAAVKPEPVVKPAINPEIKPVPAPSRPAEIATPPAPKPEAPRPADSKPAAVVPLPEAPKPIPVETTQPTNRLPVAPVALPTAETPSANVAAPKNVVVPSSIVPDEPEPAPVAPAPAPKSAKPQPTLKVRGANAPSAVTMPSAMTKPDARPAAPAAEPVAAPAPAPPPPPPGTLGHILFHGAAPFTDAELAPLTGLTIGTKPSNESLQTASSRLIDTGLFSSVRASYDTPNDVGTAIFTLEPLPASQLARVSFANIVWLTPAEIDATLKLLPLYRGYIPMGGNVMMADSIQAALQSALSARGVQATLTHMLIPPSPQHPYTAMEFRVTSPNVVLASASLFDIPPGLVNRTLKAQTDAVKMPYNEGITGTTLSDLLLAPAHNAGYIGARLWHIERKRHIVNRSTTSVDFVARMDAGPIYTVRSLNWTPTAVLSESDFRRQAALHIGQVPTTDAADKTTQVITDAYSAQGYLEAYITATQSLDPKTGAANYTYSAVTGPQYHLGSISVHGLSPEAKQDFDSVWTMKPGDVYNEGYLLNFLNAHQNIPSLKGYTFTYDRSTAPDTHKVDLTLTFKK